MSLRSLPVKRQARPRAQQPKPNSRAKRQVASQQPESNIDVHSEHTDIANALVDGKPIDLEKYKDIRLQRDQDRSNLLYRILLVLKKHDDEEYKPASEEVLRFVEDLVIDAPELFTEMNDHSSTPLIVAARFKLEVLFRVINLLVPADKLRECTRQKEKCPLSSVNQYMLVKFPLEKKANVAASSNEKGREEIKRQEKCDGYKSLGTGTREPEGLDVCLHGPVNLKELTKHNDKIKAVLSAGMKQWSCLQELLDSRNFDSYTAKTLIPHLSFRSLLQLCPDELFNTAGNGGFNPLQNAIRLYNESNLDFQHLSLVIKELVERAPSSIYFKATYSAHQDRDKKSLRLLVEIADRIEEDMQGDYTTFDISANEHGEYDEFEEESVGVDDNNDPDNDVEYGEQEIDPSEAYEAEAEIEYGGRRKCIIETEHMLKMVCIGDPDLELEKKLEFLYWGDANRVREIGLNLLGESNIIGNRYIEMARNRSGTIFETILASVKLPYWNLQDRSAHQQQTSDQESSTEDKNAEQISDPYEGIFNWLRGSNVEKIFTVEVDDTGPEPHSNAVIRKCLRDFQVEVFKWKKYDICSETVYEAAPHAKEVHLYCRGNTAILRSWAFSPELHNMKDNLNDEKDCKEFQGTMKDILSKKCSRLKHENIIVEYPESASSRADVDHGIFSVGQEGSNSMPSIGAQPCQDDWIDELRSFKDYVINMLHGVEPEPTVKIAVLDDGASLKELGQHSSVNGHNICAKGKSFRPDSAQYWVGPCKHGTMMVKCIRQLCPMAQLHVGRLDDSGAVEKQKFTTESCHKALKWAMEMDVDIISMSWSFRLKAQGQGTDSGENGFLKTLNTALRSNKVIIFASLPDKGATSEIADYVPVGNQGVIRIGSANIWGEEAQEIKFASRHFLLPGEEIPGESDKGSSFATAYAAGLAGLMLYFLRAHEALEKQYLDDDSLLALQGQELYDTISKRIQMAGTIEGMKTIFKVLSGKNATDDIDLKGFFVRPYLPLGKKFGGDESQRINRCRDIARKILPID
ncbi:Subtilisin-like protein [Fusarium austroafricanum]|uniref:Subtilisin-like protein n=1 Tax=Fusarium austroafricanum TaxID=2364996 RepID=A0A8H4P5I3_9HYPO|nr:Subtilisin-like protein [Fusarium austroafricanum]